MASALQFYGMFVLTSDSGFKGARAQKIGLKSTYLKI